MTAAARSTRNLDDLVAALTLRVTEAADEPDHVLVGRQVWHLMCERLLDGLVEPHRLTAWFGVSSPRVPGAGRLLDGVVLDPLELGPAFERSAGLRLAGTGKRDSGTYYTPASLASLAVAETLTSLARSPHEPTEWRLVDPAGGAGVFAGEVVEQVAAVLVERHGFQRDAALDHALVHSTYLVDSDPLAVAVARCLLVARFGSTRTDLAAIERHVVCGDAVAAGPDPRDRQQPGPGLPWLLTFPLAFAHGGFDAVVGNPPWGAIKPSIREYAGTVDPQLLRMEPGAMRVALRGGDRQARARADRKREYAARLRNAGYRAQGSGDTEFYRYFVELAHALVRPGGVVGLLVPSALQRASGAAPLRQLLLDTGGFDLWLDFINSRAIFDIHKMFRFSLVVWRHGGEPGIARAHFGLASVDEARRALNEEAVSLSGDYLAAVSPSRLTIPDVRSTREADLYARLHAVHPPLGAQVAGSWNVGFRRELDMTNDLTSFVAVDNALRDGARRGPDGGWHHPDMGDLLPVFEGRMVHQFDAAAKGYVAGHGRSALWEVLSPEHKEVRPRYLFPAAEAERRRIPLRERAAFCDVTGHANERTVLAALVPDAAVCGNKVPTCQFTGGHGDTAALWVAIANSLVLDWIARRRVSTTLNFFHWQELPFPRPDTLSEPGRRLVAASTALSAPPGRPWKLTPAERSALRVQIDVDVALLFGLGLDDMVTVLADFPLLDRGVPSQHRTVTRDRVLAAHARALGCSAVSVTELDLARGGGPDDLDERVAWHAGAGVTGYIPGEAALAVAGLHTPKPAGQR